VQQKSDTKRSKFSLDSDSSSDDEDKKDQKSDSSLSDDADDQNDDNDDDNSSDGWDDSDSDRNPFAKGSDSDDGMCHIYSSVPKCNKWWQALCNHATCM